MRRIFFLLVLGMSILACTLTDDLTGSGSTPLQPPTEIGGLEVTRGEDGAFTLGNPDAPLTLVVFADWYCPHCQNYKPTVDRVIETYVSAGVVKFESRILPTAGGENTYRLGRWIECVAESGENYFTVSNALYDLLFNGYQTADQVEAIMADRFALNTEKINECAEAATQLDADLAYADLLGANSTPSVWLRQADGNIIPVTERDFNSLSALIESAGAEF